MKTWAIILFEEIRALYSIGSIFSNKDLIKEVLPKVVEKTGSVGKTPDKTMSYNLQKLRNWGIVEFIDNNGTFKLISEALPKGRHDKKMSKGERVIYDVLVELGLPFTHQKKFPDLRNKAPLSYDFAIELEGRTILIEMDGIQHFKPIKHWGGEDKFQQQQKHDVIKTLYAAQNNHILLRFDKVDRAQILTKVAITVAEELL